MFYQINMNDSIRRKLIVREQQQQRKFIYQLSWVGFSITILSTIPDVLQQVWNTAIISWSISFVFLIAIFINKRYYSKSFGIIYLLLLCLLLFFIIGLVGWKTMATLFYVPLTMSVPFLTGSHNRKLLFLGLSIPLIFGVSTFLFKSYPIQLVEITPQIQDSFSLTNIILCLLFCQFLVYKIVINNYEKEKSLLESEQDLLDKNAALTKANQELDRFAYSVSHDLRSPLASALGLTMLAKEENDIEQLRLYQKMQEDSLKKLDVFVQEVLDYAKNARQAVNITNVNLKELIQEIIDRNAFNKDSQFVKVLFYINQNESFYTDAFRVQVALSNIINNAFQYKDTQKSISEIRISVTFSNNQAKIVIWDNGLGIEDKHQQKVFDMFYRANQKTKGTGLGLYLAQDALRKISGNVSFTSKVGEYTRFEISIPNLEHEK